MDNLTCLQTSLNLFFYICRSKLQQMNISLVQCKAFDFIWKAGLNIKKLTIYLQIDSFGNCFSDIIASSTSVLAFIISKLSFYRPVIGQSKWYWSPIGRNRQLTDPHPPRQLSIWSEFHCQQSLYRRFCLHVQLQ